MSTLREIEAAVCGLSPDEVTAFCAWFDRFRERMASTERGGDLTARLRAATRAERRALAVRAADESADHYRRYPDEVLPDVLDEPS